MKELLSFKKTCLALAVAQTFAVNQMHAATITVNSSTDDGAGCTLREAIEGINAGANYGDCIGQNDSFGVNDTISFDVSSPIDLSSPLFIRNSDVRINPDGDPVTVNRSGDAGSVFLISDSIASFDKVTISGGNTSFTGGGIFVALSTLSLSNSTISNNTAGRSGGGIFALSSSISLNNSAIFNNQATSGYGHGGGVYVDSSSLSMSNTTISNNSAGFNGGGIHATSDNTISIINSTISGNSTGGQGGGLFTFSNIISISNSLIAGNIANDLGSEIRRTTNIFNSSSNLFGSDSFGFSPTDSDIEVDVSSPENLSSVLLPLDDNGGFTLTHALPEGSLAIDAGDNAVCAVAPINNLDQRGEIRPISNACDIGAFESEFASQDKEDTQENTYVVPLTDGRVVIFNL